MPPYHWVASFLNGALPQVRATRRTNLALLTTAIPGRRSLVISVLVDSMEYAECRCKHGENLARNVRARSGPKFRFNRDGKGRRIFVSTAVRPVPVVTDRRHGEVGIDVNADHPIVAETDSSGNPLRSWRMPLATYGKSRHQADALIGYAVAYIVFHAVEGGNPVAIKRLDFDRRRLP